MEPSEAPTRPSSKWQDWTRERIEETKFIDDVRRQVRMWPTGGRVGVTTTTRRLLDCWTDPAGEKRLFFLLSDQGARAPVA